MKKGLLGLTLIILGLLFTIIAGCDSSKEYNYISPKDLVVLIKNNAQDYVIIDIQSQENFDAHHVKGAVPTYAFPANTSEMQEKLKVGISSVQSEQKIIIVCPQSEAGAKNTVDYYRSLGVSNDRLLILEKGKAGWPEDIQDIVESS